MAQGLEGLQISAPGLVESSWPWRGWSGGEGSRLQAQFQAGPSH